MSPHVHIADRRRFGGRGFVVRMRYLVEGRGWVEKSWTFRTRDLARSRQRFVEDSLAKGYTPREIIAHLTYGNSTGKPLSGLTGEFIAARRDVGHSAHKVYRQAFARLGALATMHAGDITWRDVNAWIEANNDLGPKSLRAYLGALKLLLDYAEIEPNPARHRNVFLPRIHRNVDEPPTWEAWCAIREALRGRKGHTLALGDVIEATGLRIGEALALTWSDVAFVPHPRVRVMGRAEGARKTGTARRWTPLPAWAASTIDGLLPLEDRSPTRPLFPEITAQAFRLALGRACIQAGVEHHKPHDLRHRYISLLGMAGVPLALISRIVGHAKSSVTSDVYSHANLTGEPVERLTELRRVALLEAGGALYLESIR